MLLDQSRLVSWIEARCYSESTHELRIGNVALAICNLAFLAGDDEATAVLLTTSAMLSFIGN
jgi:hypothetical protein